MFFTRLRLSQPLDVGQHLDMNKVGDYSEMLMAPVDSDWDEIIWTRRNFHLPPLRLRPRIVAARSRWKLC